MAVFTGSPVDTGVRAAQKGDLPIGGDIQGNLYVAPHVSYIHTLGAGTGEINLVKLPAGRVVIYPRLSRIRTSAFAATAQYHLGHRAFVKFDGTVVPENNNEWLDNVVATAVTNDFWAALVTGAETAEAAEYETIDGLELFMLVDTANIEDTDTVDVDVVYSLVN